MSGPEGPRMPDSSTVDSRERWYEGRVDLLTALSGIGKSTAIKAIIQAAGPDKFGGFFTEEILSAEGERVGFRLVTVDGSQTAVLAHKDMDSDVRVGKYGVDVSVLNFIGIPAMQRAAREGKIVVIDEIGPMQLSNTRFYVAARQIIESDARVLGTTDLPYHPLANQLRIIPGVKLYTLTTHNRDRMTHDLILKYSASTV